MQRYYSYSKAQNDVLQAFPEMLSLNKKKDEYA